MKYVSNHHKTPLESLFVLELDMDTIRTFFSQEITFGNLSQNGVSRALILEIGLREPYEPISLVFWWDM